MERKDRIFLAVASLLFITSILALVVNNNANHRMDRLNDKFQAQEQRFDAQEDAMEQNREGVLCLLYELGRHRHNTYVADAKQLEAIGDAEVLPPPPEVPEAWREHCRPFFHPAELDPHVPN